MVFWVDPLACMTHSLTEYVIVTSVSSAVPYEGGGLCDPPPAVLSDADSAVNGMAPDSPGVYG
jgi:hypothetical protein